jgi:hypothetical protein
MTTESLDQRQHGARVRDALLVAVTVFGTRWHTPANSCSLRVLDRSV